MNGIQVRTGQGTVRGDGTFTDVVDVISRTPKKHSGWQSVEYKGKRYQLHGGIRTDYFISLRTGVRSNPPKRRTKLGKWQQKALTFALKYPGWHSFAQDRVTKKSIFDLKKKGLVEVNQYRQFRATRSNPKRKTRRSKRRTRGRR